jgi:PadR family transcriptional regulator PadR
MSGITRITGPLLDVLEYFLAAFDTGDDEVHGWAIMHAVKRSGPTVYGILDRLEDAGMLVSHWEDSPPDGRPRRRIYKFTAQGVVEARELVEQRRKAPMPRTARPPGLVFFGRRWWRGLAAAQ